MPGVVLVGACQTPEIPGDVDAAVGSARFRSVAAQLADLTPVLVIGVIERYGSR